MPRQTSRAAKNQLDQPVPTTFLAADVYGEWDHLVAKAQLSVIVFSPYLDELIFRLVGRAKKDVKIVVLTDVSPQSDGANYLAKLDTLLRLIDLNVEVRHSSRLHAKILLVDFKKAVIGSQNFTEYARDSKEVSAVATSVISGTPFLAAITKWIDKSEGVSKDALQYLIDKLGYQSTEFDEARARLLQAFLDLRQDNLSGSRQWRSVIEQSTVQFESGRVLAKLKPMESSARHFMSLVAERGANLTRWTARSDSVGKPVQLERLFMCPIINSETGQVGFARIAKTRITYVRSSVKRVKPFYYKGTPYVITVKFTQRRGEPENLQLEFRGPDESLHYVAKALLTSTGLQELSDESCSSPIDKHGAKCKDLLSDPGNRGRLLQHTLGDQFRYKTLHRETTNAEDFFEADTQYELNLAEINGIRVIVASPIS